MGRPAALVKKGCGDRADEDRPLRTDDLGQRAFQLAMALRSNAAYSSNPVEYATELATAFDRCHQLRHAT